MSKNEGLAKKKAELFRELGRQLTTKGFPERPSGHSFRRRTEFGFVAVHLNVAESEYALVIAIHVSVRFDAVESIVNDCNALIPETEKKRSSTIGCELGNLLNGQRREWRVDAASSANGVASQMFDWIVDGGLPYFERFSTKEAVFDVLRKQDTEAWLNGASLAGERAIALAFLIGGVDEARRVSDVKRAYMMEVEPRYLPQFNRFMDCFEKYLNGTKHTQG
jgi:hypothetical protein